MMNGILLVNKPVGLTSHDVVHRVKKKLNLAKVGHTGTLDPFATGLLILLVGKATRLAFLFDDLDKTYEGTIVFGKLYDTDDITGQVINEKTADFGLDDIKEAMKDFVPSYEQLPPTYSAVKQGGIKAYEAARRGKALELTKRRVYIHSFDVKQFKKDLLFTAKVSKGTYMRSLARDLGEKLGTYGALSTLNRSHIGDFVVNDAKQMDDLALTDLIPDTKFFDTIRRVELNDYMIKLVKNGIYLDERQTTMETPFVVADSSGNLIAYYEKENQVFKPKYYF